jgi:hypothetical protein
MKTIKNISLAIGMMAMSANITAAEVNGAYCANSREQNGWDESKAVATFINIPKDCQKVWCAFALDGSWSNYSEIATTFTPGQTTVVTSRVVPVSSSFWKPTPDQWAGGAASKNKPGFVNLALWTSARISEKKEDCAIQITPSSIGCNPVYCDNFKALLGSDGKTIKMKGLNNCTPGNWFAYSDDGWANYADITEFVPGLKDSVEVDMSNVKYYTSKEKPSPKAGFPVEIPIAGTLSMIADANGTGKCTADNKGGNSKNGIDMSGAPTFKTATYNLKVESVAITPNPVSASETVSVQGEFENEIFINVYDLSGSLIHSQTKTAVDHSTQLNLSDLNIKSGMYIIKVVNTEKTLVGKLIIQ